MRVICKGVTNGFVTMQRYFASIGVIKQSHLTLNVERGITHIFNYCLVDI